jgi:SAM-dependent methyltransferase
MTEELVRALVFGRAALEYDRVRPGYPPALVDDALAYAGPFTTAGVVDVGAGTGRATLAFADRGARVTAVEPDARMAAVLADRADGLPVTVHVGPFEAFVPAAPFDLLICAQAWHWIDEATRWDLAADAVRPGGAVALFWNADRPADPRDADVLRAAHQRHAPDLWREDPPAIESTLDWTEMAGQPRLVDYGNRLYRWQRALPVADYLALLATTSAYLMVDDAVRSALFEDILGRLDGELVFDVDTELHVARVSGSRSARARPEPL